ncbi:MAG: Type I Iterative PKS [Geoglossum simile]|nr:MAG: Type I Iterative PKS [Geoglossum simile]
MEGLNGTNSASRMDGISSTNGSTRHTMEPHPIPIAICGMAMRLPGGISTAESFWDFLINKKDARIQIPEDRYSIDGFYSPTPRPGMVLMNHGYFLDHLDLQHMDAAFFSMSKAEVERLDPQQRLLLEVVWECLENAGETGWRGKNIGCFIGSFGEDWLDLHAKDTQDFGMYRITGSGDFVLANRISYEYDLKGPSMTIRTGCSSSMLCLHLACQAIRSGDCTSAIVGGTNILTSPTMSVAMCEQGALSPDGSCKSFDASANGYARAEGINAIYVKKLSDALQHGDPIRAVIRSTSSNCDGRTPGIANPSSEAHEVLIRRAYETASIHDPSLTAYVECHGTGTAVGDPLEVAAIAKVFGEKGIIIGSVKPNVGHSEGASAVTSVIKSVLTLEKKTIPPNIKFSNPNPKIPFEEAKLVVPVEATPWPKHRRERVSVNSFGIGGANGHVIIDSIASFGGMTRGAAVGALKTHLLVFSANHPDSLDKMVENYRRHVGGKSPNLHDLAYTLGARREHLPHRTFCITDGFGELEVCPSAKSGAPPQVVFVFTGQGAQWPQMGKQLMIDFPSFCEDVREMDKVLAGLPLPPSWTIEDELLKPSKQSRIYEAELSQPLCTALQVGLVNVLRSLSVSPASVVGHSSGEIAAAYACNAITMKEAITIAYYRGFVTKGHNQRGGMAAVGMGRDDVLPFIRQGVVIACENSPSGVTLSGDEEALESVIATLGVEWPGVSVRRLRVEMAYHSHHMRQFGGNYQSLIEGVVTGGQPTVPFYSTVTGRPIAGPGQLGALYWRQNLESEVLFYPAVKEILQKPLPKVFLEIGPHSALAGPLRQILNSSNITAPYVPIMLREVDSTNSFLKATGQLHCNGVPIDFAALYPGGEVSTDLPPYPWRHDTRYWNESRVSQEWRTRKFPHHDVLGSRVAESSDLEPTWRNMLRLNDVPWVRDHLVLTDVVYPAAGFVAIAGAAIEQLTGSEDYSVRHLTIAAALVLHESKPAEIVTIFRPARLTTSLESVWYDFSISSHNGTVWVKHCFGQARPGFSQIFPVPKLGSHPREVSSTRWYRAMKKVGLNYGPAFVGMSDISAGVSSNTAIASIPPRPMLHESPYGLHPAIIDQIFQLISVAVFRGQPRIFEGLSLPTFIDEIYVRKSSTEIRFQGNAAISPRGVVDGDGCGVADGEVVIHLKGLRLSPLDSGEGTTDPDPHAAVQLLWKPDIDFLDTGLLMRPKKNVAIAHLLVEKLALLCTIETAHELGAVNTNLDHLKKFQNWLRAQTRRAERGEHPLVDDACRFANLNSKERHALIDSVSQEVSASEATAVGAAILRIFQSSGRIFEGVAEPLEILLEGGLLEKFYNFADLWNYRELIDHISHGKPNLKILEVGAGTGGTTAIVLKDLISPYGERMYSKYCYTDISAGFFNAAKDRFQSYSNIEYAVLDISKDPMDQGFEKGSFDLILAMNVIHATPRIVESLRNIRTLLHPRGRLLLQELCCTTKWTNYVMGGFPGWWLGEGDGRIDEPYILPERWVQELKNAGFQGDIAVRFDHEFPYQINANIIAHPVEITAPQRRVTLLFSSKASASACQAITSFANTDITVDLCTLEQRPPPNQDVIALLDLDGPFFENISAHALDAFIRFVSQLQSEGVLWVTRSTQLGCEDPRYALVVGLARTIRSELSVDFATLELDRTDSAAWRALHQVFHKFQCRVRGQDLDPDYEFALSNSIIHVGRFHWVSVDRALDDTCKGYVPRRLEIGKRGLLQTLRWAQGSPDSLAEDEVEVDVRAVGLNFKDVLIAMGIVDGQEAGGKDLGCECTGVVRNVGSQVAQLKPGDRVMVFCSNSFTTRLRTRSRLCARMPDELSFEDGATMPCVYSTVIRSLLDIGRLGRHQSVLIHSACGGVGIAAIQICRMIGAEIFVTVGNEEKVQYLIDTFNIPRNRIFNSRNTSFLAGIMQETDGKGVDLVLNSLSGELLHASWQCVAEYGMMVEIGKRDFIGRGKLDMNLFEANRGFFGLDIAQIWAEKPAVTTRLLEKIVDLYQLGHIKPIHPVTSFRAPQIEEAFRYLQKGQHIGKVVITFPKNPEELAIIPARRKLIFRPQASYLLVGGLGGLGKSVSTWMAEHGATNLIYLSRSAANTSTNESFFRELEALGCSAQTFSGTVSNIEDVQICVGNAAKPIAGVIQMSMVLRDCGFAQMTLNEWEETVSPKVQGTWNIHNSLSSHTLDFFVLFSSFSGLVGQWGQGNYAAANAFLDAFVQYRHSKGLPASVLDIGIIEDVGYISQNPSILESFRNSAVHTLREQDLLDALHLVIVRSAPQPVPLQQPLLSLGSGFINPNQVAIGLRSTLPITSPANPNIWKCDRRMGIYHNFEDKSESTNVNTNAGLKQFLSTCAANPSKLNSVETVDLLANEIGSQICCFLLSSHAVDVNISLSAAGVDSLIALELRNWWRSNLGSDITVLEILNAPTIRHLGELAAEGLGTKFNNIAGPSERKVEGGAKQVPNGKAVGVGVEHGSEIRETGDTYFVMKAP